MSKIDALIRNYASYVSLPWDRGLAGAQRVWFAVYDKTDERRLRLRVDEFAIATRDAGHGWRCCNLTDAFARWMAGQAYCDAYFESPEDLKTPHPDFGAFVVNLLSQALEAADDNTVVAAVGAGSLFGFLRVSDVLRKIEHLIVGRLLVFFPGEYENNNYKLFGARDGWNYHAVPITPAGGLHDG